MSCLPCQQAEREARMQQLRNDARTYAQSNNLVEAVILEGPNGYRFVAAPDDPRAAPSRLAVVERVSAV